MDDIPVKRREIFFNNLILLGLDSAFEKKYGITFHKDMFALPNKKGYEVITYFLFAKLSVATGKDYNVPWPLLDKEHDRVFQKTCCNHLMNFSEENLVNFPRIVPSLLATFGGDRFYEVYLAFSCYVLSKTVRKSGNVHLLSRPVVTHENSAAVKQNLQLSTMLSVQKFRDMEILTHDSHLMWTMFSKNLQRCLHNLKQSLETNEGLLKKKQEIISSLYSAIPGENFNLKQMIERCIECWKPLIKQRKNLEKFLSDEKVLWNFVASEVGKNTENEFLNGQDYNICITDNLPEDCHKKLEKVGFASSLQDGKLSVFRFMKLFIAYLMYIAELLGKNLNELHRTSFVEDAASIQDDLNSVNDLNKKLSEEMIPVVEGSIKKLKSIHYTDDPKEDLEIFTPLPVLSFNPEAVTKRTSHFNTHLPFEGETSCNQKSVDCVFMPEKVSFSELNSLNCDMPNSDSPCVTDDVTTASNIKIFASTGEENSSEGVHSRKFNFPQNDSHATSPKLDISAVGDIDSLTPFKMSKSWLNEENLSAMTLPDISFDE